MNKVETNGLVFSSPAKYNDEIIVCGSYDKHLYFIDLHGNIVEKVKLNGKIFSSPLVLPDKTVVVGCNDYNVYFIKLEDNL